MCVVVEQELITAPSAISPDVQGKTKDKKNDDATEQMVTDRRE